MDAACPFGKEHVTSSKSKNGISALPDSYFSMLPEYLMVSNFTQTYLSFK